MTRRIEHLCDKLAAAGPEKVQRLAERYGVGAALDRIRAAVASGTDATLLTADLDALDDAFAHHGHGNLTTSTARAYRRVPGTSEHPVIPIWVCPAAQRCGRGIPQNGSTHPRCALTDQPLAPFEIT